MIDICLLGTGGMLPLPDRWLTSMLIKFNGHLTLLDCGEGTQIPLKMSGFGFKAIDNICITHFHADHIAGLPGLLLTIGNSGREEPITIIGPKNLGRILQSLLIIAPELPYEVRYIELEDGKVTEIESSGLIIKSLPLRHRMPCFGYSFEVKRSGKFNPEIAKEFNIPVAFWNRLQHGEEITEDGKTYTPSMVMGEERKGLKVSYMTDTRPVEGAADFVRDSDLFICEGLYGDEEKREKAAEKYHMVYSEAAEIARSGEVSEMWLTHFSPAMVDPEEHLENARSIFANARAGRDLLKTTLVFKD